MILVNGEPLDDQLVEESFYRIKAAAEAKYKVSCCERDPEFRAEAEEEVIDSVLIAQDADRRSDVDEDLVRERLEDLIKEYRSHGASWEMLEKQTDSFRSEIAADIKMRSYLSELLDESEALTEDDYLAYYEREKDQFAQVPRVRCLHICFFPSNYDSPEELLNVATKVRERALKGEDFESLAKELTEKQDKEIDLGWLDLEDAMHPFEAMVFSMNAGEVAPLLSYDQALHLIKVTDVAGSDIKSFEDVREEVVELAITEKKKELLSKRAKELRNEAEIVRE